MGILEKVKKFRDEHPLLDIGAGFIPGVGEAQDVQDLADGIKNKKYGQAALAAAGLIIPGVSGAQIRAGSKMLKSSDDVIKFVNRLGKDGEMEILKPYLAEGLKHNDEAAKKVMKVIEDLGEGRLKPEDLAEISHLGITLSPDALIQNYARTGRKQRLLGGYRGTTFDSGVGKTSFEPNFQTKYGGTFSMDDPVQVIYYSGFGKSDSMKRMKKLIETELPNDNVKDTAKKALQEIEEIFKKYKYEDGSLHVPVKMNKGLLSPKGDQVKDVEKLKENILYLTQIFRNRNIDGVHEIMAANPLELITDMRGNSYQTIIGGAGRNLGSQNVTFNGKQLLNPNQKTTVNQLAAMLVANPDTYVGDVKVPSITAINGKSYGPKAAIIKNVRDINQGAIGVPEVTDIILSPKSIITPTFKKGNKIKLIEKRNGRSNA